MMASTLGERARRAARLVVIETGALLRGAWLWGFIAAAALCNALILVASPPSPEALLAAQLGAAQGVQLHEGYIGQAANSAVAVAQPKLFEQLVTAVELAVPPLERFDVAAAGEAYAQALGSDETAAAMMRLKYELLADQLEGRSSAVEHTLAYAAATDAEFEVLYRRLLFALGGQLLLSGLVVGLWAVGRQWAARTAGIVFASRAGRRFALVSLLAAVLVQSFAAVLLAAAALVPFVIAHGAAGTWQSTLANPFHTTFDLVLGVRPFIAWEPLTLTQGVLAKVGIALLLSLAVLAATLALTLIVPRVYLCFSIVVLTAFALFTSPALLPGFVGHIAALNPLWTWLNLPLWFGDGGFATIWPWFERLGAAVAAAVATVVILASYRRFRRAAIS